MNKNRITNSAKKKRNKSNKSNKSNKGWTNDWGKEE